MTASALPEIRPKKRAKIAQKPAARQPRLFAPFRALGLITNHIPFVLQTRSYKGSTEGPKIHLVTCLGKSWALWEGGKMTLLFVGEDAPDDITCLAMEGDAVWVASGSWLIKYRRGKQVNITNFSD